MKRLQGIEIHKLASRLHGLTPQFMRESEICFEVRRLKTMLDALILIATQICFIYCNFDSGKIEKRGKSQGIFKNRKTLMAIALSSVFTVPPLQGGQGGFPLLDGGFPPPGGFFLVQVLEIYV